MTRREELAEKILLALLANSGMCRRDTASPARDREILHAIAWDEADAFLAACESEQKPCLPGFTHDRALATGRCIHCEPEQEPEREPDAVWKIVRESHGWAGWSTDVKTDDGSGWYECLDRLLAGRDRVRLRVFVEEVKA